MENEGVIAASVILPNTGNGGSAYSSARGGSARTRSHNYGGASTSDLEDLINDILTIEQ